MQRDFSAHVSIDRMDPGAWQANLSIGRAFFNYSMLRAKLLLSKDGVQPKRSYLQICYVVPPRTLKHGS